MAVLAKLLVALGLDTAEYDEGMDQAAGTAATKLGAIGKSMEAAGQRMSAMGKTLTTRVTLPLVALGAVAINAGSDLAESMSKVEVVFGEAAGQVEAFSETTATSLGISQQAALEATGTFGNLFTAMGIGQQPAADMSLGLVTLAADLASFNNIDPSVALEKLRAGMVGEVEPLRTLGVNLTAAQVAAKALEMGLVEEGEELSAAAKAQASYALILEQTTNAQGDFARTSDGLANSTRIAKAQFADMTATMGTQLLPIGLRVMGFVNQLLDRFNNLSPETKKIILVVGGLAAAIGPVLMVLGPLVSGIGALIGVVSTAGPVLAGIAAVLTGPVGLAIAAVVGLVALLAAAWTNNWGGIRDTLTEVWEGTLQPALQTIWDWLSVNIPLAIQTVSDWWSNTLIPALQAVWSFIQTNIIPLFRAVANVLSAVVGLAIRALAGLWQNVLQPALQAVWAFIQTNLIPVFNDIAAVVEDTLGPVLQWLMDNVVIPLAGAFAGIGDAIQAVIGWLQSLADAISNITLPEWLEPGSPTPFEIGLRGISRALRDVATASLPEFTASIQAAVQPPALATVGAVAGGGDTFNINVNDRSAAALMNAMIGERRRDRLAGNMGW